MYYKITNISYTENGVEYANDKIGYIVKLNPLRLLSNVPLNKHYNFEEIDNDSIYSLIINDIENTITITSAMIRAGCHITGIYNNNIVSIRLNETSLSMSTSDITYKIPYHTYTTIEKHLKEINEISRNNQ
jgi:hypothetical protein